MKVKDMTFFHYWKESLALIFSKNIKLLLFATAKAIGPVYKMLIIDFWWLFILSTVLDLILRFHWYSSWIFHESFWHTIVTILWFLAWTLLGVVTILIIRPSVHKKGIGYFLGYKKHYICFLVFTLVARSVIHLFGSLLTSNTAIFWITMPIYAMVSLIFFIVPYNFEVTTIYLSPFFVIFSLFLFDTQDCFGHLGLILKRTVNMVFYNYPIFLILFFVSVAVDIVLRNYVLVPLIGYSFNLISVPFDTTLVFYLAENIVKLFMPITLCFMANVYTVLVHNQVDLYFN